MSLQPTTVIHNSSSDKQEINANQQSVTTNEEIISEDEARRRREQLNRRPSYRMILKDLETVDKQLKKDPDGTSGPMVAQILAQQPQPNTPLHGAVAVNQVTTTHLNEQHRSVPSRLDHPSYMQPAVLTNLHGSNGETTLSTIANLHSVSASNMIGQYSPVTATAAAVAAAAAAAAVTGAGRSTPKTQDLGPLQVNPTGAVSEWQSNMIAGYNSSPSPLGMASGSRIGADSDDSTRKRQVRLLKNREAAKECRRKKKEYVKCLENRVAVLENQNKALIEELKTLKELYCRKEKAEL